MAFVLPEIDWLSDREREREIEGIANADAARGYHSRWIKSNNRILNKLKEGMK